VNVYVLEHPCENILSSFVFKKPNQASIFGGQRSWIRIPPWHNRKNQYLDPFRILDKALCNLPGREFQFTTLDNPQPLFIRYPKPVDPSATEIMKGISTTFTPEPFTSDPVDFIPFTPYAETTAVFPT
jgi:hypothetical protein